MYTLILYTLLTFTGPVQEPGTFHSTETSISPEDLKALIGSWQGSLTYLDYTSGKPFTMPANLEVKAGSNPYELTMTNLYPNEPKANGSWMLTISEDGTQIQGKPIVSRIEVSENTHAFAVEYPGEDGNENRAALIRETYVIGPNTFVRRKKVRFEGETEWILRNEFKYKRA